MELRDYQKAGVEFLLDRKRAILADEMGVGKTPQLIRAARGRTLVVAPPSLHTNWQRELERWAHQPTRFTIASYHSLTDRTVKDGHGHVAGVIRPQWRGPWDTVVFDEAHHLKGRNTGYARAGVRIASATGRVYLATGTPIRNWANEIFMLLRALYPNDKRFSSYWRWVETWFTVEVKEHRRKGRKRPTTARHVGDLRDITTWEFFVDVNRISERWLRRTLQSPEVDIELPEVQHIHLPITMAPHQRNVYKSMEEDFFATWDGKSVIATSSGSQWSNLMRLATGVGFHPDFDNGPSGKLDALWDLTAGAEGPFVIFTHFRETAAELVNWFRKQRKTVRVVHGAMDMPHRDEAIELFQQGEVEILVGTYGTLGEGHNLTRANKMILFETSYVPAHVDQAISRIQRFGQERACVVWSLVTADTVDEFFVDRVLPAKRGHSSAVIEAADLSEYRRNL